MNGSSNRSQHGHDFVPANYKTHCVFFFVCKYFQQSISAPTTVRRTLRHCDLVNALGGDTWCVNKLYDSWNPVLLLSLFYTARILCYWRTTSYHSFM